MKSLKSLDINTNIFHGELPDTISNLTNLNAFLVFTNRFSGKIPQNFGKNSPQLATVSFSNNRFSEELPPELCSGLALENFTWGQCRNLTKLQIERDKISSGIPAELGKLAQLGVLNLGANELTGEIPLELGYSLDLSSNSLSGSIPQDLGKLVSLKILNVSHNDFSRRIPSSFSFMISLSSFDFSYNELTGSIPSSGVFRNATWNAFVGNLGLYEDVKGLTPCNSSATKRKSNSKKQTLGNYQMIDGIWFRNTRGAENWPISPFDKFGRCRRGFSLQRLRLRGWKLDNFQKAFNIQFPDLSGLLCWRIWKKLNEVIFQQRSLFQLRCSLIAGLRQQQSKLLWPTNRPW
ncbi:leucine-rich repeat receptor-like protein kinase PEPR2 [Gossypium hirsutum]|uniref:Leucine-rich repeat receptor-like protein kinase PEPR2 n=1 Tax=Gossypium hirsutum TaxID=3635 RepID=A0ABM3AD89_GOSHI|nr:leucine-rich repeat receptor-like protein kinase PEPR2 [Gossypium hirsutum]